MKLLPHQIWVHWRRQWQPTPVLLPGKSHGQRSLVGCSPWGCEESNTTERLHFHFSLACIGEGNGNPLQCSCLENPRDRGAWWAAIYGVAQSRPRLMQLSSSSSSSLHTVQPIYRHRVVVKESVVFIAGHKPKSPGKLVLKRLPQLLKVFQGKIFKDRVKEGEGLGVISSWTFF